MFGCAACRHLFLVLGLVDGFQVYKVFSASDIRKVVSHSEGPRAPVSMVKVGRQSATPRCSLDY
jgi:hypothetical protein